MPLVEPLSNVGWLNWPCPVIRMDNEQLKIGEVKQSCTCLSLEHASGILMSTRIQQVFVPVVPHKAVAEVSKIGNL